MEAGGRYTWSGYRRQQHLSMEKLVGEWGVVSLSYGMDVHGSLNTCGVTVDNGLPREKYSAGFCLARAMIPESYFCI